jgi:hypothetical protein
MKKLLVLALALSCGLGFTHKAEAADKSAPAWVCQLGFKGQAKGFKLVLGKYRLHAAGNLNCVSIIGHTESYPVWLDIDANFFTPGIALGKYNVYGQSGQISLFNSEPSELFGRYMIAQGHATIVGGVGVLTAVKAGSPQLSLTLSLNVQKGFGFDATVNVLKILPRDDGGTVEPE